MLMRVMVQKNPGESNMRSYVAPVVCNKEDQPRIRQCSYARSKCSITPISNTPLEINANC